MYSTLFFVAAPYLQNHGEENKLAVTAYSFPSACPIITS